MLMGADVVMVGRVLCRRRLGDQVAYRRRGSSEL